MALCLNTETFQNIDDVYKFLNKFGTCIDYDVKSEMNIKNRIVVGKVFNKFPVVRHEKLDDCMVIELKKVYPKKCFIKDEKIFRLISGGEMVNQISSIEINSFLAVYKPGVVYVGKSFEPSLTVGPSRSLVWCIPKLGEPALEPLYEPSLNEVSNVQEEFDEGGNCNKAGPSGVQKQKLFKNTVDCTLNKHCRMLGSSKPCMCDLGNEENSYRNIDSDRGSLKCHKKEASFPQWISSSPVKSSSQIVQREAREKPKCFKTIKGISPTEPRIDRSCRCCCSHAQDNSCAPHYPTSNCMCKRNMTFDKSCICKKYYHCRMKCDDNCNKNSNSCEAWCRNSHNCHEGSEILHCHFSRSQQYSSNQNRQFTQSNLSSHNEECHDETNCIKKKRLEMWLIEQKLSATNTSQKEDLEKIKAIFEEDSNKNILHKIKNLKKKIQQDERPPFEVKKKINKLNNTKLETDDKHFEKSHPSSSATSNCLQKKRKLLYIDPDGSDVFFKNNGSLKNSTTVEELNSKKVKSKSLAKNKKSSPVKSPSCISQGSSSPERIVSSVKEPIRKRFVHKRIKPLSTSSSSSSRNGNPNCKISENSKPIPHYNENSTANKRDKSPSEFNIFPQPGQEIATTTNQDVLLLKDSELNVSRQIPPEQAAPLQKKIYSNEEDLPFNKTQKGEKISSKNCLVPDVNQDDLQKSAKQIKTYEIICSKDLNIEEDTINKISNDLNNEISVKITLKKGVNSQVDSTVDLLGNDKSSLNSKSSQSDKSSDDENIKTLNDVQAEPSICPASSSSKTYYDADGNMENSQLVASQISQLTQRFSSSEYNNSPLLIETEKHLENELKVGGVVQFRAYLIGVSPELSVLRPLRIIKGVCRTGCKGQFTLGSKLKLVHKKCKICKVTAHYECPFCKSSSDEPVLLCLKFSFDLLFLYNKRIIKVSARGTTAEKFLGCTMRHYLNFAAVSSDVIKKLNKVTIFVPPEDWNNAIQLEISCKVINQDNFQLINTYFSDSLIRNNNFILENEL